MYDKTEIITSKLNPLIKQLHELATAEGVQILIVAQTVFEDTEKEVSQGFSLSQNLVDGVKSPQFLIASSLFTQADRAEEVLEGLKLVRAYEKFKADFIFASTPAAGEA